MNKLLKVLSYVFLLLLSVGIVNAQVTDEDLRNGSQLYYTLDDDFITGNTIIDSVGNFNATNNGATCGVSGIINQSCDFDGSNDYMNTSFQLQDNSEFTLIAWIKTSGYTNSFANILSNFDQAQHFAIQRNNSTNFLRLIVEKPDSTMASVTESVGLQDDNWHMVVGTYDGSEIEFYVDSNSQGTQTITGDFDSNTEVYVGSHPSTNNKWTGNIDEVMIKNESMNSSEIQELYDRQSQQLQGSQWDFTSAGNPKLTFKNITVNNQELVDNLIFNTSSLNFSTIVQNTSTNGNVNQTFNLYNSTNDLINSTQFATNNLTGLFSLNLLTGNYTINFQAENNETSTQTQNYSFIVDLKPPIINNTLPNEINQYDINLDNFINVTPQGITGIDTCQVTFTYEPTGSNQQTSLCNNTAFTFNFNGNYTYKITANDTAGNTATKNGRILVNPEQYFYFEDRNSNPITNFTFGGKNYSNFATINVYDLGLGQDTLLFEKLGFTSTNVTFTFTNTSSINLTTQINNSKIVVKIFDRENRTLIDDREVTLTLIGSVGANATTTTGTYNFSNINFVPDEYHIIADANNYNSEKKFFDYNNQETVNANLYLLKEDSPNFGTIELVVKDEFSQFISGALCEAQQWIPENSAYETVAEDKTNVNGEVFLDIELDVKEYQFVCSKDGSTATTTPETIKVDLATRTLTLTEGAGRVESDLSGLTYTINETINSSSNTSTIDFSYTDSKLEVTEGCITFYDVSGVNKNQVAQTCSQSSSANIQQSFSINNTFPLQAEVSVFAGDIKYVLERFNYESNVSLTNFLNQYDIEFFVPLLLILVGLALGISLGNIYISSSLIIVGIWTSFIIVPTIITGTVAVSASVIIGLIIWGSYRIR